MACLVIVLKNFFFSKNKENTKNKFDYEFFFFFQKQFLKTRINMPLKSLSQRF